MERARQRKEDKRYPIGIQASPTDKFGRNKIQRNNNNDENIKCIVTAQAAS